MKGQFDNIKIQGISAAVPEYVEQNEKFTKVIGSKRVKKQIRITGVKQRHISGKHQRASDLCYTAATKLLDKLQWDKKDIVILIYITQSPNYAHPSTAFFLQNRLGLGKDCLVYDMNLGCSSFNVGVHTVSSLLQQCNIHDKALLLLGDVAGRVRNPEDSLNADDIAHDMLFGSAGAAIALEKVKDNPLYYMNKSDGSGFDAIIGHWGRLPYLDGAAVFSFAINDVSADLDQFKQDFNLSEEAIDYYVFHQAQDLILDNIVDACNIPVEKELRSLSEYGNTSGASVAVTICANAHTICSKEKVKMLMCGFGVGLSWGCIYSEMDTENILPIIETNEHYDEDKKPAEGMQDKNIVIWNADSVMGEWIGRYDNDKSATVVLAGTNESKLREIQSDLFMESYVCVVENNKAGIFKIFEFCEEKNIKIDGIVIPNEMQRECLEYIMQQLAGDYGNKESAVVVLESTDIEGELLDKKNIMENKIKGLSYKSEEKLVRVNGLVYANNQVDIVQIVRDGQEWIDLYFEKECPETMKNPIFIAKAQEFLLSDDARCITESVIAFNTQEYRYG